MISIEVVHKHVSGLFGQALNCTCLTRASLAVTPTGETDEKKDSRYQQDKDVFALQEMPR